MNNTFAIHATLGIFGLLMGITLGIGGFADFGEVHRMFTFVDYRLFFAFIGSIILTMIGFAILTRGQHIAKKSFNKGTIPGSIMFGVGWAICGACPSIALVQLGQGQIAAIATVFGIFSGVWVYRRFAVGSFKLDSGVCGEE